MECRAGVEKRLHPQSVCSKTTRTVYCRGPVNSDYYSSHTEYPYDDDDDDDADRI